MADTPSTENTETETASLVIKLEKELKKDFKIACVDQHIAMKDELTSHIRSYVGKHKKM